MSCPEAWSEFPQKRTFSPLSEYFLFCLTDAHTLDKGFAFIVQKPQVPPVFLKDYSIACQDTVGAKSTKERPGFKSQLWHLLVVWP